MNGEVVVVTDAARGLGRAYALGLAAAGYAVVVADLAPAMKRQRSGKIVNTSSATVPSGVPGFFHYASSKAAIVGLTRALAR